MIGGADPLLSAIRPPDSPFPLTGGCFQPPCIVQLLRELTPAVNEPAFGAKPAGEQDGFGKILPADKARRGNPYGAIITKLRFEAKSALRGWTRGWALCLDERDWADTSLASCSDAAQDSIVHAVDGEVTDARSRSERSSATADNERNPQERISLQRDHRFSNQRS